MNKLALFTAAGAALMMAGAAYAQDTTGASKSHMGNPQAVPGSAGGSTSTMGASKSHMGNPAPAGKTAKKKAKPATGQNGDVPKGGKNKAGQ